MSDLPKSTSKYSVWHPWTDMAEMQVKDTEELCVKAEGRHLFDGKGRVFDGSAGLWNVNIGHGQEEIALAIAAQLSKLTFHSLIDTRSHLANGLAQRLLTKGPENLGHVMFHCNGTSATEGALMTMRQLNIREGRPEKTEIIALDGGFHGSSYLMAAVSGIKADASYFAPLPIGIHHLPAPFTAESATASLDALRRLVARRGARIQSFIAEPLMGCEAAFVLPAEWLREAVDICQKSDITIIADEVATGLGRTGDWFAWPKGIHVDALSVGKGLSAGYVPITATLYDKSVFERFASSPGAEIRFGSTMDGCPGSLACGHAVLDFLERHRIPERAKTLRDAIEEPLANLLSLPIVQAIQGKGLMIGIRLCSLQDPTVDVSAEDLHSLIGEIRKRGVLLDPEGTSSLLFYPPLTSRLDELRNAIAIIHSVIAEANNHAEQEEINCE